MTSGTLANLWPELWADLHDVNVLWQVGTIAACLGLAWSIAQSLRAHFFSKDVPQRVWRLGVESFSSVLWPSLALLLIVLAKPILGYWHHVNLLRLAIPLIGSFALIRLAFYMMRRVFARSGRAGNFLLLFEKVFALVVWGGVALYITGVWPELMKLMEETFLPLGKNKVSLLVIVQAGIFVAVTLILALWAGALLEERLMRVDDMHSSLRVVMARMGKAVLILIAVLISLSLVGIDLTVLSVFGGALGVGLGLGLQKIVSSYVSGFVILLERSLAIGDIVSIDKYSGKVTQINTRYTLLRGFDGVESIVPNEMLLSSVVQNHSLSDRRVRLATRVTVDYKTDVDMVLQLLERAAAERQRVCSEPAPQALLVQFGADGLELELGFWISDPENGRGNILSEVNRAVLQSLQAHDINIPYPQREIRLIGKSETFSGPNSA